ncbi:uncharacterized protein EI90DRAFT_3129490 [Cantharellus anzutake]|uniref:uncharacterized protein n=1 Tax=Cantharellus anzutake TaxID=1750568 RepID=UPI0019065FED|nr:uncharacterized protein EI90DRAFT_3129490 [Cantharellus anzutake]KAF8324752.1 hypothetical protein EI90DRAFT_3129490 [Cantharellus anzutake]
MAHETAEYGGFPTGDWAFLSYDILMDNLFQALCDHLQEHLVAVQANPAYQRQLILPRDRHVPILDPSGPWDSLDVMSLGPRMACLDPKHHVSDNAGVFIRGMSLCLAFERMFSEAHTSLASPPQAH